MTDKNTSVAIYGAAGRMGRRLVALAHEDAAMSVAGAVEYAGSPDAGKDAGELAGVGPISVVTGESFTGDADVAIDFSAASATANVASACVQAGRALVVGTTGLGDSHQAALDEAAKSIPVLQATNFSLVVNVLWKLAAEAAVLLGDEYDIEVLEAHHRFKKDAPSGTAHTLAQKLCEATGRDYASDVLYARHGDAVPRQPKDITVQTLRLGDHAGEHTAYFATLGERLEIKHVSTSRDSYALGALRAAKWLAGKPAGRYTMADVLGFAQA